MAEFLPPPAAITGPTEPASNEECTAQIEFLAARLEEMPGDHPARTEFLLHIANLLLIQALRFDRSRRHLDKLRWYISGVIDRPGVSELHNAVAYYLTGMADGLQSIIESDSRMLENAAERLQRAAEIAPSDLRVRDFTRSGLATLLTMRYAQTGELVYLEAAHRYADELASYTTRDPLTDEVLYHAQYLLIVTPVARKPGSVDEVLVNRTIMELEALLARIPDTLTRQRSAISGTLNMLRTILGFSGTPHDKPGAAEATGHSVDRARAVRPDDPSYLLFLIEAGLTKIGQGFASGNRQMITEGIGVLTELSALVVHIPELRSKVGPMLAVGFALRYTITLSHDDLKGAISYLEEARRATEEEFGGIIWAETSYILAHLLYLRNDANLRDRRRAIEFSLDALQERAARVMLQSTPGHALDAAMDIIGEAADVARWRVAEGDLEAAADVVERGRGMVLHAASVSASVPSRLRESGHNDLAVEWEKALDEAENITPSPWDALPDMTALLRGATGVGTPPTTSPEVRAPSDLRYRVLQALAGGTLDRMLAPPPAAEVVRALRTAQAQALIYLIPQREIGGLLRGGHHGGLALVLDANGETHLLSLPRLVIGPDGPAAAFTRAQHDRYGVPEPAGDAQSRWENALSEVCDWAWTAAMEQVLGLIVAGPQQRARLILVPVGGAGQVPWHAARRAVGPGDLRYACEDAIISYAVSARQFTEACRRPHRPWDSAPALVRVPGSGLPKTEMEITEIHRRYYPGGILLGGQDPRSRSATPGNVRRLLPRREAAGASLLHLGCHAQPAPHPVDGCLLLAGHEELSMRDILDQARARPRDEPGGLVILAACGTDLTAGSQDEALTLATSFLAAGAAGAVGSRWPVEDLATMALMLMFHHYLNSGYDSPATALRAAQLWMLDPGRSLLPGLPPGVARRLRRADLAQPGKWAAFTYQGQ